MGAAAKEGYESSRFRWGTHSNLGPDDDGNLTPLGEGFNVWHGEQGGLKTLMGGVGENLGLV